MAAIAGRIADLGGNIDRIERMARYPVTAIELDVSGADPAPLRSLLAREAAALTVDVAVQPASLLRHAVRLIVMDVDSTLIQGEVIEMLAAHAGFEAEVAAVTEAAMRGEIDFEESLRARVRLLAGLDASVLDYRLRLHRRQPRRADPGPDAAAAGLPVRDRLGRFQPDHRPARRGSRDPPRPRQHPRDRRRQADRQLVGRRGRPGRQGPCPARVRGRPRACPRPRPIAIGDGANDLDMLEAAGLGIAYNARPVVREVADTALNVPYLDAIMYLLGISREEIEAADAADGIVTPAPPI